MPCGTVYCLRTTDSHFIVGIHIWSQKLFFFLGIGTLQINYPKHPSSMAMHPENVSLSCLLCFSDFLQLGYMKTYKRERLLIMEMPYAYAPFKGEGICVFQWS